MRALAAARIQVRAMGRHRTVACGEGVEAVTADLSDFTALLDIVTGIDAAVHCAAALSSDADVCTQVNVQGTRHLLTALAAGGCKRLVHISSVSVYNAGAAAVLDEDSPCWSDQSHYPYGRTKAAAERLVAASGLGYVVLRPAPVLSLHASSFWGPLALQRARVSTAPIFGFHSFPFVHVDNLAQAVLLALRADGAALGRCYNVVDFHGDTSEYLSAVAAAIGRAPAQLPLDAPDMRIAGERIRRDLGYDPPDLFQDFLAGMRRLSS